MLVPIRVNTLTCRSPWSNLAILAVNIIAFALLVGGVISNDLLNQLALIDWSPVGLLGYQFLHAGLFHLIGNMLVLWVFGNALNGVMPDVDYLLAYLGSGILAGMLHLALDGDPAIGASGAICGLMGMYLSIYPKNEVTCFYWFFRPGTFEVKGYILIIAWFIWDVVMAVRGQPGIASWAHVGGTLAGFGIGILLLKMQRIYRGDYDNPTALELLPRRQA